MLVDSHAHLMFPQFKKDLDDLLARARTAGVEQIVNVGTNLETSRAAIDLAE
ncbi:MAG: TatD family hydrolase, partial [Gemmatimonadota bacterium]|nr:TatD family hydrolase [Gemmatimonadota bacterium]